MKNISIVFVLFFAFLSLGFAETKKIPSVVISKLDGTSVNTTEINNDKKPILYIFFATWATPAIKELDELATEYETLQKETGIKIVAISIDSVKEVPALKKMIERKNWKYEIYVDLKFKMLHMLNTDIIPYTLVVNGEGDIVWKHEGFTPEDKTQILTAIRDASKAAKK